MARRPAASGLATPTAHPCPEIWRVPESRLQEAQDDATIVAIHEMERAGLDVISDGEMRRESYSNRFVVGLDGIDVDNPGSALDRTGHPNPVPRVVAPIEHSAPVMAREVRFAKEHASRPLKISIPGPFTLTQQAQDDFYGNEGDLAMAFAAAVNAELSALKQAGADYLQIDEPYLQARPDSARSYALQAINSALAGIPGPTVLHTCFGYAHIVHDRPDGYAFLAQLDDCAATYISIEAAQQEVDLTVLRTLPHKKIILGVIDLADDSPVETPYEIADRIHLALAFVEPERLALAPDCGMKYLARDVAFGKLSALVEGTRIVRDELGLGEEILG